ncbi:MAG: hypothetical protein ABJH68_01060 [Ilumatobacter sp.]|uniref:hypothetical protein n=1 Tax=Ilumatobacter sp. TaxID=1967498 RepID=UPI0032976D1B
MKPLAIWAVGVVAAFAGLTAVTGATRDTEQVFVVVDTSQPMVGVLNRVPLELDRIDDREHTEFALATVGATSSSIHGYQSDLEWVSTEAFRPCSFEGINAFPDASSADERILVTNAQSIADCSTDELDGWTVVELR